MGNAESHSNPGRHGRNSRPVYSNGNTPSNNMAVNPTAAATQPAIGTNLPTISPPQKNNDSNTPGAVKMPGAPRNQRFYVTIPPGVRAGQHFAVLVNGQQMMVKCPEGQKPGERLIVTAPQQDVQQYVVNVPANVQPGQQFRAMINNQEVMVSDDRC